MATGSSKLGMLALGLSIVAYSLLIYYYVSKMKKEATKVNGTQLSETEMKLIDEIVALKLNPPTVTT